MSELRINLRKSDLMIAERALSQLETVDKGRVVQDSLKKGTKIIMDQGKTNLAARNKVRKGNLKGSFTTQVKKKYITGYAGFRRPRGSAAHLIDRGTAERYTKSGAYRGKITGTFFWTDAVREKGDEAINILMDNLIREINDIMNN